MVLPYFVSPPLTRVPAGPLQGQPSTASALLKAGADVAAHDSGGCTLFLPAAWSGDGRCVSLLAKAAGAPWVDEPDVDGLTPLLSSLELGVGLGLTFGVEASASLHALLDAGASPNTAAPNDFTALHFAAAMRDGGYGKRAMAVLLQKGENPSVRI